MTAEEINRSVVQDSGRTDLCVNYATGDFAPTVRALELLNEAHQFLDRLYRNRGTENCHTIDIEAGDYQISVPNIRNVTRMDMVAADGARHELRRRSYAFMREQYGESFDLIDVGEPIDWAYADLSRSIGSLIDTNFLTKPIIMDDVASGGPDWKDELLANPNRWVAMQSNQWSWASGTLSWNREAMDETTCLVATYTGRYTDVSIVVDIDIAITAGTIIFGLVDYDGTDYTTVSNIQTVSASGNFKLTPTAPWNIIAIGTEADEAGEGSITRVSISEQATAAFSYIFMPPANMAYTLSVFGGYYTPRIEAGTNISWWSDTYPSILMMAYRMVIERHKHANETRVAYWMKQIAIESKQLQIDLVAEETTNPPKYMRRMPSAVARRHLT